MESHCQSLPTISETLCEVRRHLYLFLTGNLIRCQSSNIWAGCYFSFFFVWLAVSESAELKEAASPSVNWQKPRQLKLGAEECAVAALYSQKFKNKAMSLKLDRAQLAIYQTSSWENVFLRRKTQTIPDEWEIFCWWSTTQEKHNFWKSMWAQKNWTLKVAFSELILLVSKLQKEVRGQVGPVGSLRMKPYWF